MLMLFAAQPNLVIVFRKGKYHKKRGGKGNTAQSGDFLGEEIQQGGYEQNQEDDPESDRHFHVADPNIQGHLEFPRVSVFESQHHHGQGLEDKAPDNAESVCFPKNDHVAATDDNGEQLKEQNQEKDPISRAVARMRAKEPVGQHPVFRYAVQHTVRSNQGRVDGSRQNQETDHYHEGFQRQLDGGRPQDVARQSTDEVGGIILHAHFIGNDQDG